MRRMQERGQGTVLVRRSHVCRMAMMQPAGASSGMAWIAAVHTRPHSINAWQTKEEKTYKHEVYPKRTAPKEGERGNMGVWCANAIGQTLLQACAVPQASYLLLAGKVPGGTHSAEGEVRGTEAMANDSEQG